ncbi:transglycosylase domain-containing protein [Streptomyces sp. NBC_00365]|uniref:transglycosylase domain-containing protein n=1 Tax=Streptomyces sp. NBC_00365 TaxID=2975726 RepID=UPI00224E7A51|nr:transglycosylase domain-containing protein [Streptomyces sp. NBC_00365]MCX5090007.1 transglycosylase domain-containing protein [Streptomyces sp. NBC_00365]
MPRIPWAVHAPEPAVASGERDDRSNGRRGGEPEQPASRRTRKEGPAEETTQLRLPPQAESPAELTTQLRVPPQPERPAELTTQLRVPPQPERPAELTTQLRVPSPAELTTRLRIPSPPEDADETHPGAEESTQRADGATSSRHRGARRKPAVPSALAGRWARVARRLRPAYPRPGRTGWRRWVPSWRQWLGAWGLAIGLSGTFLVIAYAATDIPQNLNTYATQQDNVYFWSDGTPMARTGWVRRQAMPLKDIPQDVRWAVLAAENESFYSDPGISFKGISRALVRTVGEGNTEGGSTITQQYVKNVYLNQNRSVSRKFTEAMISLKLDQKMSKDKILEGYLNTSWFGRGTYGIQRAAQAYYGKDVGQLDAGEAAMLASLLKGAGLYDPTLSQANHKRAVERWSWILDRMVKIGKLSPAERAKYTKFPEPTTQSQTFDTGKQSDYLVELATQYAKKAGHISDQQFDLGGYQIYTTFDRKRETALTDAVAKARKKALKDDPKTAKAAHYGASSVAADGKILAVYGGPDHRTQGYNESNATTVPAGSAFLPFVYAAGLEHGIHKTRDSTATPVTPETLYDGNDNVPVTTPEGPYWDRANKKVAAHNDGNKSWGRISLRRALAESVNVPFMQLGMDTGLDKVRQTAEAAGLLSSSMGPQVPALSLGNSTPSAIRMANAYATFAAGGSHIEPYSVRRLTRNGSQVALATPRPERAVSAEVAREVTEALTDAFGRAHPTAAGSAPDAAGKAGTTADDTAAWYVGTNDSVSTAVVLYRIDLTKSLEPLPLKGLAGASADDVPYGIWAGAMSPLG